MASVSSFFFFIFKSVPFVLCLVPVTSALCHGHESSALLQLKESFIIDEGASYGPAYPKIYTWKQQGDCCSWDGVTCDERSGHVIGLDLSSSCLYGSINSSSTLFHLVHLRALNLANNHFNHSPIPSSLAYLPKLSYLNLSGSSFSGQIPSNISELSKLSSLDLSLNDELTLKTPNFRSLVQNLTSLEELNLSWVEISSSVPEILANFSSLKSLSVRNCGLNGEFPSGIFRLANLQALLLSVNWDLSGHFPEFNSSSPLRSIQLSHTRFSGELPPSIGNLGYLDTLNIWECYFLGQIPASLGNLTRLDYLDLSDNNFESHNISSLAWIGKETKLTLLGLSEISLNGQPLPAYFANLTQLDSFLLSACQITGPIPSWLMNMTQLTTIELSRNSLRGPIQDSILQLENLEILNLSENNLSGIVDFRMFPELKRLQSLLLSNNQLTLLAKANRNATLQKFRVLGFASCHLSRFPSFLHGQDKLQMLDLSNNNIQGEVPEWIWNTSKDTLEYLDLSNNHLIGFQTHPTVFPWTRLTYLQLSSNMLRGSLPIPPPSTVIYSISNNKLTGEISPYICSLNSVYALDLSYNNLSGMLPPCLGNFSPTLQLLNLAGNNFSGKIPHTHTNECSLRMIMLDSNQLEGQAPRSLSNCANLEFLSFENNRIFSPLGALQELKVLILRHNRFHGFVGSEDTTNFEFPMLRIIDLSHNNFSGQLPTQYFLSWKSMKVKNEDQLAYMQAIKYLGIFNNNWLTYHQMFSVSVTNKGVELQYSKIWETFVAIDFSSNKFDGDIPKVIGKLNGLHLLNLSNNHLSGVIPSSLGNLSQLESLDLSQNHLSGEIPQQLTQLNFLAFFNVSHNHLMGYIPQGKQFDTFQNDSYIGNSGLCGIPLSIKCGNSEALPPSFSHEGDEDDKGIASEFGWKQVLIGYCSGLIFGLVIGHIVVTRKFEWFLKTFRLRRPRR
uniref:Uncharacterized protein n=3 Tax=Manihot esculenta TaxID=3983 RepID=A0A2C9WLW7_MANES